MFARSSGNPVASVYSRAMRHVGTLCILLLLLLCIAPLLEGPAFAGAMTDAVKARDVGLVRSLLAAGADVEEKVRGDYPLNVASLYGPAEMVAALLDAGAMIEQPGRDGLHPLHNAVLSGRKEIVALLLNRGASVDAKDRKGRTPLIGFSIYGGKDVGIARLLLAGGADPNQESAREDDSTTALQFAAGTGNVDLAELLIAAGANVNHQSALGDTPLHQAVYDVHPDMVRTLVAHGADPTLQNQFGKSPLDHADEPSIRQCLIDAIAKRSR